MKNKQVFAALLSKGYFPRELPPAFRTLDFGAHADDLITEWEASKLFKRPTVEKKVRGRKKANCYTYKMEAAEAEAISKPKKGYERRVIHITHPIPQSLLAAEIAHGWKSVQTWLSRQTYSLDVVEISDKYERGVKEISFLAHQEKIAYLHSASDWLVSTDITRFYPSIYTHSIPWAAYGKEKVKANLVLYDGSLGDRLDVLVRACNRNQTIGIPIGPETSRIIAEVISARIDVEFSTRNSQVPSARVDRLQDDWQVGAKSLAEAESILASISKIYGDFGLEINGSKTNIERINLTRDLDWKIELSNFLSHRPGMMKGSRLRAFIDLATKYQSGANTASVANYALAVLEGQAFEDDDVPIVESFLLRLAFTSPGSLDRVCRIILSLNHYTRKISKKRVADRCVELIDYNLEKNHGFELLWLLTTLRGLKRPVALKRLCQAAPYLQNSSIILTLLDIRSKGLGVGKLPTDTWTDNATPDRVRTDWSWLYAYEGIRHGWIQDKHNLMAGPFFEPMKKRDITFYDPARNVVTSLAARRKAMQLRKRQISEMRKMLRSLRGHVFWDYW